MLKDPPQMQPLTLESVQPALSALPIAICCVSLADQRIVYSNAAFVGCFGYDTADLTTFSHWLDALPDKADRNAAVNQWAQFSLAIRAPGPPSPDASDSAVELAVRCKGGEIRTVLQSCGLLPEVQCALLTFIDISQRKLEAEQVQRQELASRTLLDHSHEMILIVPEAEAIGLVSPAVEEITGWSEQEYVSNSFVETVHPDDRPSVLELRRRLLEEGLRLPLRYRTLLKDGSYRWVEGFGAPYRDPSGRKTGYVLTLRDIAKQKEQEDTLARENSHLAELAQVDELTGIANRRVFKTALNREARRRSRSSQSLALLLLDVDNFKKYNDLYGHLQGDACLRQVAQTLKLALHRVADLVARYGGEEFVMLLPMTEPEGAERVAQNVLTSVAALRIPHAVTPAGIVTVSIGVSTWPASREMDEERLIEEADRALYRAKNQGRNMYCVNHLPLEGPA